MLEDLKKRMALEDKTGGGDQGAGQSTEGGESSGSESAESGEVDDELEALKRKLKEES
jgi:hypothetical protein